MRTPPQVVAVERSRRIRQVRKGHDGGTWRYTTKGETQYGIGPSRSKHLDITNAHDVKDENGFRSHVIEHHGWYLDDVFQDETIHGAVLALPHGRFLSGYEDPFNDGMYIWSDEIFEGKRAHIEAARRADRIAEIYAEHEREYQTLRHAAEDWAHLGEQLTETRARIRALIKAVWPDGDAALYRVLSDALCKRQKLIRERAKIWRDNEHIESPIWNPGLSWKEAIAEAA